MSKTNGNGSKSQKSAPAAAPAPAADETKSLDKKLVLSLFQKVFDFKTAIEAEEAALREKRKQSSGLLAEVLKATNGFAGPFEIPGHPGRKFTIAQRTVKVEATETTPESSYKVYYLRAPEEQVATSLA